MRVCNTNKVEVKYTVNRDFAIIDVHSLLHRAFYALPRLTTASGEVTNAIYGFAMMLWRIFEEDNPAYIGAAVDLPGKTFRHERFAEYKANRKEMPEELQPQVARVTQFLEAFRIPVFGVEGYEADDVIGTLTRLGEEQGLRPRVYTGDRDSLQLASDRTQIILTRRGITEVEAYDAAAVYQRYGLTPAQMIDLKGLMGDSSDNIPGVRGIGEKTALQLISTYGSIEGVYAHLDELPTRQRNLLAEGAEAARLSRELATIVRDLPLKVDWESLRYAGPDLVALRDLFMELEFHSLLAKIAKRYPELAERSQGDPVAARQESAEAAEVGELVFVRDAECRAEALARLMQADRLLVFGCGEPGELRQLAVAADSKLIYLFVGEFLAESSGLAELIAERRLVGHDLKGLLAELKKVLPGLTRRVDGADFDLQLASYLHNPTRGHHTLTEIIGNYSGHPLPPQPGKGASEEEIAGWLAQAVIESERLVPQLTAFLQEDNLWPLFTEVEMPLAGVLGEMEEVGILVDRGRLAELSQELGEKIRRLEEEIFAECGERFNLNSPKQLGEVLFERMHLPPKKKTKSGYSTSAEVLEELAISYPFVRKILDYRQYVKLKGTYVDAFAELIGPDGRIHTTYNQAVTATGRLSSTNPNLQNIPIRTEEGRKIRSVFIAAPGYRLVNLDYSQIELRVLAHLSGDEKMLEAFQSGEDIHTRSAREVFGVDEVTPELRRKAKAINFGIIYGISPFGLSRDTGISVSEAGEYIANYFARYPKVKEYLDAQVAKAQRDGYVETILHRRRYLPDINAKNRAARAFAERTAMNTPIQGSAADIIKVAMLKVDKLLREEGYQSRMLLQIHDELVFEVPEGEVDEVVPQLQQTMATAIELSVPLVVEAKVS